MDDLLRQLAQGAERGEEMPLVRVFAGGNFYAGLPASTQAFLDRTHQTVAWEIDTAQSGWKNRLRREQRGESSQTAASSLTGLTSIRAAESDTLTLVDAEWIPPNGGGLRLPAVRLSLDAIEAWWVAGGTAIPVDDRGGGGWFVGGVVSE